MSTDITSQYLQGGFLAIGRCVCGAEQEGGYSNIASSAADPRVMPCCGRRLYFSQTITVLEVTP